MENIKVNEIQNESFENDKKSVTSKNAEKMPEADVIIDDQNAAAEEILKEVEKLKAIKNEGNAQFKSNKFKEAEAKYEEGINYSDDILSKYTDIKYSQHIGNIKEEKILLMSNLAMVLLRHEKYQDAFNLDMNIVTQYNPLWDKSYNRIIICCLRQNNLILANQYASLFKMKFNEETVKKYSSTFNELEQENIKLKESNRKDENLSENTTLKSSIIKEGNTKTVTTKKKPKRNMFNWVLGSGLLIGSIVGLFYLVSYRKKFIK
jgi:tetratricopeptide (TPR) repeat protein